MNTLNIWIYEDEPTAAEGWAGSISAAYGDVETHVAYRDEIASLFGLLHERRRQGRQQGSSNAVGKHDIDEADVVVIDYDLLDYFEPADTTGSRLAYLLRCFTECGFIIVLNEYEPNTFDLSLRSHSDNFADLHVDSQRIGNPGLWQPQFDGYRPWHWPVISRVCENFEKCVDEVEEHLKDNALKPLIEFLELNRVIDWIPMQARDFLAGGQKPIEQVTLEDFVRRSRGGVESKESLSQRQTARVAAARIGTLLNSIILPEQNALVDAPHLASRFGSVFRHSQGGIDDWNKLCDPVDTQIDDLLDDLLKDYRFPKPHWLWRPAWFWPGVNSDERIKEVRDPWDSAESPSDWVFCEDVSKFVPIEHAIAFRAYVSPPFIRRYVCNNQSEEARRFVNDTGDGGPTDLSSVEYVPQAALSR